MNIHELYMKRCLTLAEKGLGKVSPNPMVGSVLVYDNTIIGEGYHEQFGCSHAEVNCIKSVKEENRHLIKDSTLYVSLEPCNHFGKTPPCTDLIIQEQIKKVVIGCRDSHSKVNGAGIEKLKNAGVIVEEGVLNQDAILLNRRFFTFHNYKRPYIILKWAQSNNGKIAAREKSRLKISNEITDRLVHKWRSEEDAIMVGTNTVICDNPALTTRFYPGKNPIRIFVDKQLRVETSSQILDDSTPTIIFNCVKEMKEGSRMYLKFDEQLNFIQQMNDVLYRNNILSIIIEGGATLLNSFIEQNLWDEARVIVNRHLLIDDGIDAPIIQNGVLIKTDLIQNDSIDYFLSKPE